MAPGGDQTGPRGEGKMTGRGLGTCPPKDYKKKKIPLKKVEVKEVSYDSLGRGRGGPGRGLGPGRGRGIGRGPGGRGPGRGR